MSYLPSSGFVGDAWEAAKKKAAMDEASKYTIPALVVGGVALYLLTQKK